MLGAGNFVNATLLPAMKDTSRTGARGHRAPAPAMTARASADKFGFRYCASDEPQLLADPRSLARHRDAT